MRTYVVGIVVIILLFFVGVAIYVIHSPESTSHIPFMYLGDPGQVYAVSSSSPSTDSPFRVFSPDSNPSYMFTDLWTGQPRDLTPSSTYRTYFTVWANRCNPPIPNSIVGDNTGCVGGNAAEKKDGNYNSEVSSTIHTHDGNILFTSYQQANNCTLAQTAFMLGENIQQIKSAYGTGLIMVQPSTVPAGTLNNYCILPSTSVPTISGIVLDYEVADGRTPEQTTAFLTQFTTLVHAAGKSAVLYIDPLTSPNTQKYTGIDSTNAYTLSTLFDSMTLQLENQNHYSGAPNIQTQFTNELHVLQGANNQNPINYNHLAITYDLSCTSLSDAATVRSILITDHIPIIMWWRNQENNPSWCAANATPAMVQSKIACIVHDSCE